MNVVGLDLGLASAGAARIYHADTIEAMTVQTWCRHSPATGPRAHVDEDARRIRSIAGWAVGRVTQSTVLVVIEGPAYDAEHGLPHERAGVWWLVVDQLVRHGIPIARVAPSTAKRYMAGHGRSSKAAVQRAVGAAWPGRGLHLVSDHEADGVSLATCGLDWLGWPGPWLEGRRGASLLKAVRWPDPATVTARLTAARCAEFRRRNPL